MIRCDLARPRRLPVTERGMREDQRLGGRRCRLLHQLIGSVRHIDDDAHLVATPDDLGAERRQALMHAGLGLDVAQLVRPVVRELEMAQRPALIGLVETFDPAFEEIGAFGGHDDRGPS